MPTWFDALRHRTQQLKRETLALSLSYRDPRTPWYARVFVAAVVAYAFSPIDLIPDFIPVLGYLDDLLIVPGGIYLALKMIPPAVLHDARQQADTLMLGGEKKIGWIGMLIVLAIWLGVVMVIVKGIWWVYLSR